LASHDAYRRNGVPLVDRLVVGWSGGWLCADFAQTAARPELTGYLHLAVDLRVERIDDQRFELRDGERVRPLEFFGSDAVELAEGWYCPEFGRRLRNLCFVYRQRRGAVQPLGWRLDAGESPSRVELNRNRLLLRTATASFDWSFG
jgi:hypothetical protein